MLQTVLSHLNNKPISVHVFILQNPLILRNAKGSCRLFTVPDVRLKSSHGTQSPPFILLRYTHSYLGLKMTGSPVE